jgi:HK97 family phage portal protein
LGAPSHVHESVAADRGVNGVLVRFDFVRWCTVASRLIERWRALPLGNRQPLPLPNDMAAGWAQRFGSWLGGWGSGGVTTTEDGIPWPLRPDGLMATESTVAAMPAAWKCCGFLANAVASCAPPTEFDADGNRVDDMARSPIVERPWVMLTAHEFWSVVVTSLLMTGNFIGLHIDRDPTTGYPRQVFPLPTDQVSMTIVDGMPVYGWAGEAFGWDEVVHVRNGYMRPGCLWGTGVVEQFRTSLTNMENQAAFGASTFSSAAEASVVIQVDRPSLDAAEADAVQALWIARHASGVRRPAVIPRSMTITPLSFSPADAQYLESRQFTIAEIAFMFLMDPTDLTATIGGGGSLTYANREQREIERLTHPVGHLIRRIEQAWADLLPSRRSMAFNVDRLLRTDTLSRMQAEDIGLRNGTFTLNDARSIERLPAFGSWADVPFAHDVAAPDTSTNPPPPTPTPPTAEGV